MEFLKERCFTSLNADELRAGDKVIVAEDLATLRDFVLGIDTDPWYGIITEILPDKVAKRFVTEGDIVRNLAYLVERKENCTNCGKHEDCGFVQNQSRFANLNRCENYTPKTEPKASEICINCEYYSTGYCNKHDKPTRYDNICSDFLLYKPKTEQKAENYGDFNCEAVREAYNTKTEPHYRPFKDTDELIKVWGEKVNWGVRALVNNAMRQPEELNEPFIWVRRDSTSERCLIVSYTNDSVYLGHRSVSLHELWEHFTFLDGSVCGVEE